MFHMKRSGFKRKLPAHQPSYQREDRPRAFVMPTVKPLRPGTYAGTTSGVAIAKPEPIRSEAYRRAVASLACIHCGRDGCQCAHANTGKGMATKASDLESFPLCPRCHVAFDQGALFSKEERREIEPQWAAATRAAVDRAGLWPANLPRSLLEGK
jgi:hypothetical protein